MQASYELEPPVDSSAVQVRLKQIKNSIDFIKLKLKSRPNDSESVVVFCGDFNVNGLPQNISDGKHSVEYMLMMDILSAKTDNSQTDEMCVRNVIFEHFAEHPVTTNTILNGHNDFDKKCLDYIFEFHRENQGSKVQSVEIASFPVENKPFSHLSDHSGVVVVLHI